MIVDRKIRRGNLAPPLEITVTDDGVPIDLTEATSVTVAGVMDGEKIIDRPATSVTELGIVTLDFLPADTLNPGIIVLEVEIMWPGNKPQAVPVTGRLIVEPDL